MEKNYFFVTLIESDLFSEFIMRERKITSIIFYRHACWFLKIKKSFIPPSNWNHFEDPTISYYTQISNYHKLTIQI